MKTRITIVAIVFSFMNTMAQNNNFYALHTTNWYDSTQTGWSKISLAGPLCACTGPGSIVSNNDPVYIYHRVTSFGS